MKCLRRKRKLRMKIKKICSRCKQLLPFEQFDKNRANQNGLHSECKECRHKYDKNYRKQNKEKINEYQRNFYKKNKAKMQIQKNNYYKENREKISKQQKIYHRRNREKISERCKNYREQNKGKFKEYFRNHYKQNKEKLKIKSKEWREQNRGKYNEIKLKQYYRRYRTDIKFRLNRLMSSAIRQSLKYKSTSKNGRPWESFVNFTLEKLIAHLESLFQDGMTWDNQDNWHIDHIKPISLFNFESVNDSEFKECWSLDNLQPLWAGDNLRKSNKYQFKED